MNPGGSDYSILELGDDEGDRVAHLFVGVLCSCPRCLPVVCYGPDSTDA